MKIGAENKTQVQWMVTLLAMAVLVGIYNFRDLAIRPNPSTVAPGSVSKQVPRSLETTLSTRFNWDALVWSQSIEYEAGGRNIFRMKEPPLSRVPTNLSNVPVRPAAAPSPTPSPMNVKFYGFASKANEPRKIFLTDEGEVFLASHGDIFGRKYKVVQINKASVVIEDVLNNDRRIIPLAAR